jgi:hypothetical protein
VRQKLTQNKQVYSVKHLLVLTGRQPVFICVSKQLHELHSEWLAQSVFSDSVCSHYIHLPMLCKRYGCYLTENGYWQAYDEYTDYVQFHARQNLTLRQVLQYAFIDTFTSDFIYYEVRYLPV